MSSSWLYSAIITNALYTEIQLQPKTETILTMAENTSAPSANRRYLGSTCFLFLSHHLPTESVLSPSLLLCWLNPSRHLLWFSLIISKPIWIENFSLHPSSLGWGPDILSSFDRLVKGA